MKCVDDRGYHAARAKAELKLAEQADDPAIAKAHRELAALHKRRLMEIVHFGEPQVSPRPLIGGRTLRRDAS